MHAYQSVTGHSSVLGVSAFVAHQMVAISVAPVAGRLKNGDLVVLTESQSALSPALTLDCSQPGGATTRVPGV